jgi:S-adenosylmethionine:tRNA ribosyltransferase-isomerase
MRTVFFDYELPPRLIAQEPCPERDQSRLLVVRRDRATFAHHRFADLPELLAPGDLLVLNDTRVLSARLVGRRARTGGRWEGLFLRAHSDGIWELLCKTRGRLTEGELILVEPGPLQMTLVRKTEEGHWVVRLQDATAEPEELLERFGQMPLPPYIRKGQASSADREHYQTVFARRPGAVAAPTAGLHFTPRMFERLAARSIRWTFVTLHVGLGTFQPVQAANVEEHRMHREWGELPDESAAELIACKDRGGRIVAVGTTSVRVLETVAACGPLRPWSGETGLYIYPPYAFRAVDALITNFHLPRTSLLFLVSAFAGIELTRQAYKTAIEHEYRFYSYGDAMLVL